MNEKLAQFTKNLSLFCLSVALILSPLFFLPLTTDFFQLNKQLMFTILTIIALISWLVYNYSQKTVSLTLSPLLLPFFLFSAIAVTSSLINTPQNSEAWLTLPALLVTCFVYFILTANLIKTSQTVRHILHWFVLSALLTAILAILSALNVWQSLKLPAYLTVKSFNLTGSPLNLVTFLLSFLPISLIFAFKVNNGPKKLLYFLSSGVIISAIILVGYQLLPNHDFTVVLLPKLASWSIATDVLKTKAFFGTGPGEFVNQFTQFKPIALNRTAFWTVTFTASGNEYLQTLTTLGLLGLGAFIYLIIGWYRLAKRQPGTRITSTQAAINLSTAVMLVTALFIPFSTFHWLILAGYLGLSVGLDKTKNLTKVRDVSLPVSMALPLIIGFPILAFVGFFSFNAAKVYSAELYFQKSLVAANANNGTATYNYQIKAINLSPNIDRYHVAYSSTNLALASSLAAKSDLTDQDRQTITQLIQQSIREGRNAVSLAPNKASGWENLANIYRQLINFAQGADQFSIAAYNQAIQLDPANPALRLELGGLYYSLKQYDQAIPFFQQSVQLKPDFANGYYNLSHAYSEQKKYLEAYQAMQQVEALVQAGSADATTVKNELADLKAKLPKEATQPQTNATTPTLTQPSPAPTAPKNFTPVNVEPAASPTP